MPLLYFRHTAGSVGQTNQIGLGMNGVLSSNTGYVMAEENARFDPVFCGKVVRIGAVICAIEYLFTLALINWWVPISSACRVTEMRAVSPVVPMIYVLGPLVAWICIIAIFWTYFAKLSSAQMAREDRLRKSVRVAGTIFRYLQPQAVSYNFVFTVVFTSFAVLVAVVLVTTLLHCGP